MINNTCTKTKKYPVKNIVSVVSFLAYWSAFASRRNPNELGSSTLACAAKAQSGGQMVMGETEGQSANLAIHQGGRKPKPNASPPFFLSRRRFGCFFLSDPRSELGVQIRAGWTKEHICANRKDVSREGDDAVNRGKTYLCDSCSVQTFLDSGLS